MIFDNHKFTSYYATLGFLYCLKQSGAMPVTGFLRERAVAAYGIVDAHLADRSFMLGERPTIADLSLAGYVFMPEDTGIVLKTFSHIEAWKARLCALRGWKPPYELMLGEGAARKRKSPQEQRSHGAHLRW